MNIYIVYNQHWIEDLNSYYPCIKDIVLSEKELKLLCDNGDCYKEFSLPYRGNKELTETTYIYKINDEFIEK